MLAYAVIQRTQEIGLRMALGAGPRQLLLLVLGRGLACAALGIALGLAGAVAGTRYLQAMLYGVTPLHAGTFAVVGPAFAAVAAVASYVPARRATQVDPLVALRAEQDGASGHCRALFAGSEAATSRTACGRSR